jgi:subtilisin family serine protease
MRTVGIMRSAQFNSTPVYWIALAVSLLLIMMSIPQPPLNPSPSVDVSEESLVDNHLSYQVVPKWRDIQWDWASYSDSLGYVDVIISLPTLNGDYSHGVSSEGKNGVSATSLSSSYDLGNLAERTFSVGFRGYAAHINIDQLGSILASNPTLEAYPDISVKATVSSNLIQVGADKVWTYRSPTGDPVKGKGVVVAVIDTGVDYTHPDLGGGFGPGYKVVGGYDFYNNDPDPVDDNGHGTHVAGIIAANGGVTGVAPEASILAYKVLGPDGYGRISDVIAGIEAAIDPNGDGSTADHADVISLSLGGDGSEGDPLCLAVEGAVNAGVTVVVAAGNEGPSMGSVGSPGLAPDAITVGALDGNGVLASFSSRGVAQGLQVKPEVSAPGVSIKSTVPFYGTELSSPTGYLSLSGTSMATPHVSGSAALLIQLHPDWTPQEIKSAIVTGTKTISESLWNAGSGSLWIPASADTRLFVSEPIISYGHPDGSVHPLLVENSDSGLVLTSTTSDWNSLLFNGTRGTHNWANLSAVSPSSLLIPSQGTAESRMTIAVPGLEVAEGYYEGSLHLRDATHDLRVSFAYAIISQLTVHTYDMSGCEFIDTRGGVWVFSLPDAKISVRETNRLTATSAVSFMLPAGTYSVHAGGHQLLYSYPGPYLLSRTVSLARMQAMDVSLPMSDAHQTVMNLTTDGGQPIFVMDFLMYGRYTGLVNISFQVSYSDSLIRGESVFGLPKSKMLFISDTNATIGISLTGFSYSAGLWEFMSTNRDRWFEFANCTSTEFRPEATADLKYLLSWEFDGINSTFPDELGVDRGKSSTYYIKYDIPGIIGDVWGYAGGHMAMGGDASFYQRSGSFVSLNPFFTGITRRTIVQGVYSAFYWPGNIGGGYLEEIYNIPDYDHVKPIEDVHGAFIPNEYSLTPANGITKTIRVGSGPFYPSIRTVNSDSKAVLIYPLLRDQSGAGVESATAPTITIYRDGVSLGGGELLEYLASPSAERIISLSQPGAYSFKIDYSTSFQVCDKVAVTLSFAVPSSDPNPPQITGLTMPQRFIPGQMVPVRVSAADDSMLSRAEISWRPSSASSWRALPVSNEGQGSYAANIQTSGSDTAVDLLIKAIDSMGNYIEYVATNASIRQMPVVFELAATPQYLPYNNSDATVLLTGKLTDAEGSPLCQYASVPIELTLDGTKVATILDDYITNDVHIHNGTIRFEWHLNPLHLFEGPDKDANIQATFDLGVYAPVVRNITLHPQDLVNDPPVITLTSPSNNSLVASGQLVNLDVADDGPFSVVAFLDGREIGQLSPPWNVDTSSWSDGRHVLLIIATDDHSLVTSSSFTFEVDSLSPSVVIIYPRDGGRVPLGSTLTANVFDLRLQNVYYYVDGGPIQPLSSPYNVDLANWSVGSHTVTVTATDGVGHMTSKTIVFEIVNSSIAVQFENPANGGVMRSGTPIAFSVAGSGTITSRWYTAGVWQELGGLMTIPTDGWSEGVHSIIINSTSDLGGFDQVTFTVTVDDTTPVILLNYPSNNSFVSPSDNIRFQVFDANIQTVDWTIWDRSGSTAHWETVLSLASPPSDGYFNVSVTVVDKAGNKANASFMFAMDSSPPSVSFANMSNGDAIRPSQPLNFTATDAFLSTVQWAFDSGALATISPSFAINTSSLSGGLHQLTVVASDLSGKKTTANISFYIDAVAPNALITSSPRVTLNATCTVTASVSDDYGIGVVQLFYELQSGGYGSVMMAGYDGVYVAELAPDLLWRGMTIYVLATDKVGNVAESPRMTLSPATSPFDGNLPLPDGPSGWGAATWTWIVSTNGLAVLGSIGVLVLAGVVLYARRRREDESTERAVKPKPSPKGVSNASPFAELPPPKPIIAASARQIVDSVKAAAKTVGQVPIPTRVPTAVASGVGAPARVLLLDSIPEIAPRPDLISPEDDIDYGELIERELNTSAWKNSVFGKGIGHSAVSSESDTRPDRPGIISGLKLMKIME